MKRKRKTQAAPDSLHPWPILLLAIDPGQHSGWAVFLRGQYLDSGELGIHGHAELHLVIETTLELAAEHGMYAAIVIEHHPWMGSRTAKESLERARGVWIAKWLELGGPKSRVVNAHLQTWRSRVIGRCKGSEIVRREAQKARATAGRDCGPDESAAVCIGVWASQSGVVGAKLPKSARGERVLSVG